MLKFQFALEQRIDETQEMILNELKSGPYELIHDPDVKEIWKSEFFASSKKILSLTIHGVNRQIDTVSYIITLPRRALTP